LTILKTINLASSNNVLPDDGDRTKTMYELF